MTSHLRRAHAPSLLLLLACACSEAPAPAPASAPRARPLPASPAAAAIDLGVIPRAIDDRGLPRLLTATGEDAAAPAAPAAPAFTATDAALAHLGRLSAVWGVAAAALPRLQGIGEVPAPGATIARIRQSIDGLPIEDGELRVLVRDGDRRELVAASGTLLSADAPRAPAAFPIDDAEAVARAVAHRYGRPFAAAALGTRELRLGAARLIRGRDGDLDVPLARAQRVWHDDGGALIPAWVVEAYAGDARSTTGDAFRTVLSADGERVLSHESLVADAGFSYRVFAETTGELHPLDGPNADYSPHPTGVPNGFYPPYIAPSLVTVDGLDHPLTGVPDPWLPAGRTETLGNNVEAYTDINPPDGLTFGDFRATATAPGAFDRTYDLAASPLVQDQQMAAITSAFYGLNWLHDFWYDAGFTEAAGNGQDNNYGRGGEDHDAMHAETEDNAPSSLNNANMSTPSDGMPPRMQIFVWTSKEDRRLTILPANRMPAVGATGFGPFVYDISAPIVLAVDPDDPVNDGCTPLTNDVAGKIVLVDRGLCTFKTKAVNIQNAGGIGMIVANNVVAATPPGLGNDTTITTPITIGLTSVTLDEGNQIKAELAAGPVSGILHRAVSLLDGGLDSTLLAHEFGHYLHHRLQQCGTKWCGAISEGWGDFDALMLMIRDGDNYDGAYPFGLYTTQGISSDPAYFGIRRAPYSANPAINALSYRHMADGVELPTTHPLRPSSSANSEVHNAGEVWAETMLEVYVALLEAGPSYAAARAKMAKYVVAGLMMAPKDATPTETRDALLAVAAPADREIMLAAFSRRGMGSCAVTPARESTTFAGIVEGFEAKGRAAAGDLAFEESVTCDHDGILDAGETATLSVPISNQGHLPLADVTVTVSSRTPGITVTSAPTHLATFAPGAAQMVMATVVLDKSATGPLAGEFSVRIEASNGCTSDFEVPFAVRLNIDEVATASATDEFDATSVWQATGPARWRQIGKADTPLDRVWHGADDPGLADARLESPPLMVSAKPFRVTITHRYKFEYDGTTAWDGGLIEYSRDGGASWLDVLTLPGVAPGYTGVITPQALNPLGSRMGYTGQSAGYPEMTDTTLDFGTMFAGQTVRLRFRLGTDQANGAPGWDIDRVAFEGITNKPFPIQVEEPSICENGVPTDRPPPDEQPGCCDAGPLRGGDLALACGVLVLLVRRRRS